MSKQFAIIGAGMSGLSCASRLRELGHDVVIFEKSRGVSGRISTRRLPNGDCDHGAQYMTASTSDFQRVVESWRARGLVELWSPRMGVIGGAAISEPSSTVRYVGTPRMTSPLSALAEQFDVKLSMRVHSLERRHGGWVLKGEDGNVLGKSFDTVIFAIPAPQAVQILGDNSPLWREAAASARMLPCWAVMATVAEHQAAQFDAAFVNSGPLAWIANNASKPGRSASPIWTLHASAAWTSEHLGDDPKEVSARLIDAFEGITQLEVSDAIAHRWLYAKAEPDSHRGYLWDSGLRLAACGDWLLSGNVEGAWQSGRLCAEAID